MIIMSKNEAVFISATVLRIEVDIMKTYVMKMIFIKSINVVLKYES